MLARSFSTVIKVAKASKVVKASKVAAVGKLISEKVAIFAPLDTFARRHVCISLRKIINYIKNSCMNFNEST